VFIYLPQVVILHTFVCLFLKILFEGGFSIRSSEVPNWLGKPSFLFPRNSDTPQTERYGVRTRWRRDFLDPSVPVPRPTLSSVQRVPVSFPGVQRPGRGDDYLTPSSVAVEYGWTSTSASRQCVLGITGELRFSPRNGRWKHLEF